MVQELNGTMCIEGMIHRLVEDSSERKCERCSLSKMCKEHGKPFGGICVSFGAGECRFSEDGKLSENDIENEFKRSFGCFFTKFSEKSIRKILK